MDEERFKAYLNLIQKLLSCPSGEEPEILNAHQDLLDAGLVEAMLQVAEMLTKEGDQNNADYLRDVARQLAEAMENSPSNQLNFLLQVLQATSDSNGDSQIVYPLLQQNLDLLDDNLAQVLRSWATATLAEVEPEQAQGIAGVIGNFSNLIQQFPLGSRASNLETAITGYEAIATVFNRQAFPQLWATLQNNLGAAYSERIRGERAENLESAIAAYTAALSVYTRDAFPVEWARTQYNLGNTLRERFQLLHKVKDIKQAIAAYENAIEVIEETEEREFLANCLYRLGKALFEGGFYTKAIEKLQFCQQIYQQQKNIASLASTLFELASLYHCTGRLERARLYFKDALRLFRRLQDEEKIAAATTALGNLEIQIGKIPQALNHLRTAQEYYQEKDNPERLKEINHLLQILQHA